MLQALKHPALHDWQIILLLRITNTNPELSSTAISSPLCPTSSSAITASFTLSSESGHAVLLRKPSGLTGLGTRGSPPPPALLWASWSDVLVEPEGPRKYAVL